MNNNGRFWFAVFLAILSGVWLILGSGTALASGSGNPVLVPSKGGFTFALEAGYLTREMKGSGGNDDLDSYSMHLKGMYGVTSRLALYGRLGLSDLRLDRRNFTGSLGAAYGAGLSYAIFRSADDPTLNILLSTGYTRYNSDEGKLSLNADEYTGALIITKGLGDLLFYGGLRGSFIKLKGDGRIPNMDADDNLGLLVGVDYGLSEHMYLTGEIHLFDEFAAVGGLGFNFGN